MPLLLTDEQTMLRDTARGFIADNASLRQLRKLRDDNDTTGFSWGLWKQFSEIGFTGILIPESEGGLGLGAVEVGIVLEAIGYNLSLSPFLATAVGAVEALKAGSAAQRNQWFPAILGGDAIVTLAIDEGTKHRPASIALKAERFSNGFRLNGVKRFVAHGHIADLLIVAARTSGNPGEERGITMFAVKRDAPALTIDVERLVDASLVSRIAFDGAEVGEDAVIGDIDGGWEHLSQLLTKVRTAAAAELLGVGSGAADMTIGYLKERKQFGTLIGTFQALQHRASHLYAEIDVARAAVLKAQQLIDVKHASADRASMVAKAIAGVAATLAVQEGVQLHGGIGMTDEHNIGFFMKRARVVAETFGDTDFLADALARASGY
jgi:alkylation response protein AidB-like acyl-CoA dehydrogenase